MGAGRRKAAGVRGLQLEKGRRARLGVALGPDGDAGPDRAEGRDGVRGLDWRVEGTRLGDRADLRWKEVRGRGDGGCRALDLVADQSRALRELGLGGAEHRGGDARSWAGGHARLG